MTKKQPTDQTDDTTDTDASTDGTTHGSAGTLAGLFLGGVLGLGAVGTASADAQGQVGTSDDPLQALYTDELNGGVTGGQSLTSLTGDGLEVDANALSAVPARPDVDDGSTSVTDAEALTLGSGLTLTDDGDGTVTVELDTRYRVGPKLSASDGDGADRFGQTVSISGDGSTALVGAPRDEDPNGPKAGSAYVFDVSGGWTQVAKLSASDGDDDDLFGRAVSLSDDGTTALVGAWRDENPNGSGAGSAYVFDGSGGWSGVSNETTKLSASDGDDDDRFGRAVSISGDGSTALVGARKDENPNGSGAGSAYVFDGSGGWSGVSNETTKLSASDGTGADRFGFAVSISGDGSTALVGAPKDQDPNGIGAGSAYVFDGSGGWSGVSNETTKLSASDGDDDDRFGRAVSISGDGSTALVGAPVDEDPNGTGAGSAYVFDGSGGWSGVSNETTKLSASDGDDTDRFGFAVSISGDGSTALVGAWRDEDPNGADAGSTYVFDGSGGWNQVTKLSASDGDGDDRFGFVVSISDDGTTALVGAPVDEDPNGTDSGSAYSLYETL